MPIIFPIDVMSDNRCFVMLQKWSLLAEGNPTKILIFDAGGRIEFSLPDIKCRLIITPENGEACDTYQDNPSVLLELALEMLQDSLYEIASVAAQRYWAET